MQKSQNASTLGWIRETKTLVSRTLLGVASHCPAHSSQLTSCSKVGSSRAVRRSPILPDRISFTSAGERRVSTRSGAMVPGRSSSLSPSPQLDRIITMQLRSGFSFTVTASKERTVMTDIQHEGGKLRAVLLGVYKSSVAFRCHGSVLRPSRRA